jgi:hypothetical protein
VAEEEMEAEQQEWQNGGEEDKEETA